MTDNDYRNTWERYVRTWKLSKRTDKLAAYAECLAPSCVYTDPLTVANGYDELADYMLAFHQQVPGGHFVTQTFIAHHGRSIAQWSMRDGEEQERGVGISYAEYDETGRITCATGFFEVPAS